MLRRRLPRIARKSSPNGAKLALKVLRGVRNLVLCRCLFGGKKKKKSRREKRRRKRRKDRDEDDATGKPGHGRKGRDKGRRDHERKPRQHKKGRDKGRHEHDRHGHDRKPSLRKKYDSSFESSFDDVSVSASSLDRDTSFSEESRGRRR